MAKRIVDHMKEHGVKFVMGVTPTELSAAAEVRWLYNVQILFIPIFIALNQDEDAPKLVKWKKHTKEGVVMCPCD